MPIESEASCISYSIRRGSSFERNRLTKRLLVQTFIDNVSKVLSIRNPKLDKLDALWSAEIVLPALIGFLPALAGRKISDRYRIVDALNQILVRYLEPVLKPPKR